MKCVFALCCAFVATAMSGCASTTAHHQLLVTDAANIVTEAARQAAEDDRVLVTYFTATWCGPCRRMSAETLSEPRVERWLAEHGRLLRIDVDEHPHIAEAYRVDGIPLTIAFRDGNEFDRLDGLRSPEEYLQWLDDVRTGVIRLGRLREAVSEQRERGEVDPQAQYALATEFMRHELYDEAAVELAALWPRLDEKSEGRVDIELQLPSVMRTLVRVHPEAAKHFRPLRDSLPDILGGAAVDEKTLNRWVLLSAIMKDQHALLAWLDSRSDEDLERHEALIQQMIGSNFFGWGDLHEAAVDLGRWDAVIRTREFRAERWHGSPDLVRYTRRRLADFARMLSILHEVHHDEIRQAMCYEAATLHAACLAMGRDSEASAIADALLARVRGPESRLALLEQATRAGRVHHYHRVWLAQARVRASGGESDRIAQLERSLN